MERTPVMEEDLNPYPNAKSLKIAIHRSRGICATTRVTHAGSRPIGRTARRARGFATGLAAGRSSVAVGLRSKAPTAGS